MSEGLNKVILIGNIGADPELRFTQGGQGVLNLRLATTERFKDKDDEWKERTEWHSIVVWGKRAEALEKILAKGSHVAIEGGLRTSKYEDKDGNERYKTEIHALHVFLCGEAKSSRDDADNDGRSSRGRDDDRGRSRDDDRDRGRGRDREDDRRRDDKRSDSRRDDRGGDRLPF